MKSHLIILLIFLRVVPSYSQTDSINKAVSGLNDSLKIETYLDNSWKYRSSNPTEAIKLGIIALNLSQERDFPVLEAKALNFLGVAYTNIGQYKKALQLHQTALDKAKEANDWKQTGYSFNNIGGVYCVELNVELGLKNIRQAISIFRNNNYERGIGYCYINIGRLYSSQGNYNKSIEYFNKAAEIRRRIHDTEGTVMVLLEIAKLSVQMKDFYRALETFYKLEKLNDEINYIKGKAEVSHELSALYLDMKDYKKAMRYGIQALDINRKILNAAGEIKALNELAIISASGKDYSRGKEYLVAAMNKAVEINDSVQIANSYYTSYKFHKLIGNSREALKNLELYSTLRDSILSSEEATKLGEMESISLIEKKQQENELLQNDLSNQRKYLTIIVILFLVIVIIVIVRYLENKKTNRKLSELNKIKDQFFSIIAHDLRGPYNALLGTVELLQTRFDELSDNEKQELILLISNSLKNSYELTENLLIWAETQKNSLLFLPKEIKLNDTLRNNIDLVKNNSLNKLIDISYDCPEELSIFADEQMLNTIIRNLLFNAVKFTPKGGWIKVTAQKCENSIMIRCEDNGIGMEEKTIDSLFNISGKTVLAGTEGEKGTGLGLVLINEFVQRHNGTISVDSIPARGSIFTIKFPQR